MVKFNSTVSALSALGYELSIWEEPGEEPEKTSVKFSDLITEFNSHPLGSKELYRHQIETIEALERGENVILTARTGSGKTEAWAVAALRNKWRVLAVYPTLALAADQIRRLEEYYEIVTGHRSSVVRMDRPTLEKRKRDEIASLAKASVIVTNPAFLLAEMKRIATAPGRALLEDYLSNVDLIVFDELDFYGPRGANLLLAMAELIVKHLSLASPRIVVLSATLGNPQELAAHLESITKRQTSIIKGKPFRTPNRTIVVLGKGIRALKEFIKTHTSILSMRAPWILDLLEDEESFREHLYEVYEALEAIGLHPPHIGMDPIEILHAILESSEPGMVTLVFTKSIRVAERLYNGLLEKIPQNMHGLVGIHHHLISKTRREAVEEAAREGRIRLVITVRTLAQGIDIGTVNRVVHIGLPVELREYMQREGRKGRRKEIGVSETIIIPASLWDRKLLEAGTNTLKEWLMLPLEKLYVNPSNHYAILFKALWKLLRGITVSKEEESLLYSMGFVEGVTTLFGQKLSLTRKGLNFWNNIGFYEHGPPYGYRKIIIHQGREELLRTDEVSLRDAIEKYQPGTYDIMTENIVVSINPREYRLYEEPPEDAIQNYDWLVKAVARYEDIKRAWNEKPSFINDLRYGRIYPLVTLIVSAPRQGFGDLIEEPLDVVWFIESRYPRLSRGKEGPRVYHELASVPLNAPVAGRYHDYTYGYTFETPSMVYPEDLRLGLAFLLVFLRINPDYAVPLDLINYHIISAGSVKLVHLWESEAAGLLSQLDWIEVARKLENYEYPSIAIPLVAVLDPQAALKILQGERTVSTAKDLAIRVARILAGVRLVEVEDILLEHPQPSSSHGIGSIAILYDTLEQDGGMVAVVALASYDGDNIDVEVYHERVGLDQVSNMAQKLLAHLDRMLSRKLRIFYYGEEQKNLLYRMLLGSYTGLMLLRAIEQEGKISDVASLVPDAVKLRPLMTIIEPRIKNYIERANKTKARKDVNELEQVFKNLAKSMAIATYRIALAAVKGRIVVKSKSS